MVQVVDSHHSCRLFTLRVSFQKLKSREQDLMLTYSVRTCTSSLYTLTYDQLEMEFHISREAATLGLSTYVFGLGFGPMVSQFLFSASLR